MMRPLYVSSTAVLLGLATPAIAQGAQGTTADDDSDAIIVTARRSEERLQDVPISITVYNQDQLQKRNVAVASDLATYTPSLSVNTRYGPEKATFAIRGFNQDGQGDYADWLSTATPYVQDAFGTPGTYSDLAAPELTAYDVVGYTVVPEPMACSLIGLGAIGVLRRRRARVG